MGEDRDGNLFWYFGGIHLYKENKLTNTWSCVARSTKEWNQVRDSFKDTEDKEEIWFRETIEENFDPILTDIEKETIRWSTQKRQQRIVRAEKRAKKKKPKNPLIEEAIFCTGKLEN